MELNLQGKCAIVTGGSAGIGLACAKALAAEGVSVVIAARDEDRLANAVEQIGAAASGGAIAVSVRADLTEAGDIGRLVQEALARLGRIDILINNAGSAAAGSFVELEDQAFEEAWQLKLLGYIRMVRAVAPHMIERRDGCIVNIVGGAGRSPTPTFLPGGTANAALLNFTKGIARELAQHHVRINAISPGMTATERAERLLKQQAQAHGISVEEERARRTRSMPLGRMVDPREIAALALFLVSEHAASITGAEIVIDGGSSAGL
jgi:3-oxoacyl-[acyl-carrier protein] reductase/bacilysin biosynthesis oxidoreductase BacG